MRLLVRSGLAAVGIGVGTFLVIAEGCSGPSPAKANGASTRALGELLGKLLDKDPSDAVITQMISRGVPTPIKNTIIHPTNAKPPTIPEGPEDIACVGGFLVPMPFGGWDARFRGVNAPLPCGSADTAITACDPAATSIPFPDGDVVLTWTVVSGDARNRWASPASSTNELGTAFSFASSAPTYEAASTSDFYNGMQKWWIGGPVTGTPAIPIVTAKTATGGDQTSRAPSPTTARVLVRENAIVFVQPISEVGATPQGFRQTTFLDNSPAVKDWSGDVFPEPRAEAPFPSTGPGCSSSPPIIIREDANPPRPRDASTDAGIPLPRLIGVIPGSINRWNMCRRREGKLLGGMQRFPNADGGEEDVIVDLADIMRRILGKDAGAAAGGDPSPVRDGRIGLGIDFDLHWGKRAKNGDGGLFFSDGGRVDGTNMLVRRLNDGGIEWVTDVEADPNAQATGVTATSDGAVATTNSETGAKAMFFNRSGVLGVQRLIGEAGGGVTYRADSVNSLASGDKVVVGGLRTQGPTREAWMTILTAPTLDKTVDIVAPIGLPGLRIRDAKATDTSIALCGSVTDGVTGADQPILLLVKLDDLANVGLFRLTFPSLGANVFTEMMTCELTPPDVGLKWGLHYVGNAEVAPQSYKPFVGTAQVSEDGLAMTAQELALHPTIGGGKSFADGCLVATGPQSGLFTHTAENGESRIVIFDGANVGGECAPDQKPTTTPASAARTQIAARAGTSVLTTTTAATASTEPATVTAASKPLTTQLICQ